jgi:gluconate 2-dehydrogenase subunit 3-like protein
VTISRRRFLGGAGLTGLLAVLAQSPIGRLLGSTVRIVTDGAPPRGPLDDHELKTLMAFSQVLIPSPAVPGGADAVIHGILKQQASESSSAAQLRAAAAFLDAKSFGELRLPFAALDLERRRRLVGDLLRPYTTRTLFANPYYYLTGTGRSVRRLWSSVAKPIMVDFYASPLGWRVVGYSRQPGECSNLTDYQFPVA